MVTTSGIVIGLSVLLASISAAIAVPALLNGMAGMQRTVQIRSRLIGEQQGRQTGESPGRQAGNKQENFAELLLASLCTNGVLLTRLPTRYLCKLKAFRELADRLQSVLATRIPGCNQRALAESLVALCFISGLLFYLLTNQILLALLALALPPALAHFKTQKLLREKRNLLREQLPDALRGLSMCFMAGLSLEQAFDQTAQECREPLRRELRQTVNDLHTGSSIMESLAGLDTRLAMDEMQFVSVALEIQHRTGGSMREVLESAAGSLLASFDLTRSLEVQTSQARMSARIVSILPVALVLVLSLTMEGYLATFFSSAAGLGLLLCAVGMQLAGILAIRKILGIDLK